MSGLRIEYVHASLEIDTTPARFSIKSPRPHFAATNVGVPAPTFEPNEFDASSTQSNIWEQVWSESGYRTPRMQQQYFEDNQNTTNATGMAVQNGGKAQAQTKVAHHRQPDPVQQLARQTKANSRLQNLDLGNVKINWDDHLLEINWEGLERPEFSWEPGAIEIRLKEHPSITISFDPPESGQFQEPMAVEAE